MQKIMIGITGTRHSGKRMLTSLIAEDLRLMHINMQQPAINACAGIANMDPYDFYRAPMEADLTPYSMTAGQLLKRIQAALIYNDRSALIKAAEHTLAARSHVMHLFNGVVVSGITRDNEADWLRSKGGLLIHLENTHQIANGPLVLLKNEDALHTFDSKEKFNSAIIPAVIETLRSKITKAAA